jgi:hypothetical protein
MTLRRVMDIKQRFCGSDVLAYKTDHPGGFFLAIHTAALFTNPFDFHTSKNLAQIPP